MREFRVGFLIALFSWCFIGAILLIPGVIRFVRWKNYTFNLRKGLNSQMGMFVRDSDELIDAINSKKIDKERFSALKRKLLSLEERLVLIEEGGAFQLQKEGSRSLLIESNYLIDDFWQVLKAVQVGREDGGETSNLEEKTKDLNEAIELLLQKMY